VKGQQLPDEKMMLSIGLTGLRERPSRQGDEPEMMDFYDLKGVVEGMLHGLHIINVTFRSSEHPSLHPGKTAEVLMDDEVMGVMGELHPLVKANYEMGEGPVLVAEFDLAPLLDKGQILFDVEAVPTYPPVLEDLAVVVNEAGQLDFPTFWTSTTHARGGPQTGFAAVYVAWMDVHGAGAQRSDPKAGSASEYPQGRGPQGDAIRIDNYVRLVRDE